MGTKDGTEHGVDYQPARTAAKSLSIVGTRVVIIGVLIILVSLLFSDGVVQGVLSGLGFSIAGLLVIAAGLVTKATSATAENTKAILALLSKQQKAE